MTARDVLDQITERAEAWVTVDMHSDVNTLVAVVRGVLDLHKPFKWPAKELPGWRQTDMCVECSHYDTIHWPCDTVRTVTEALGGGE